MTGKWPKEEIPSGDLLYQFVHQQWFNSKTGQVSPTFFKNAHDPHSGVSGMSTDWGKYSSAQETRNRAKDPAVNGVIEFTAGEVAAIPEQRVEHTPIQDHPNPMIKDNRAHADVLGPKDDLEIKRAFSRTCRIVIEPPPKAVAVKPDQR